VTIPDVLPRVRGIAIAGLPTLLLTTATFLILFQRPLRLLLADWWTDPEAGHGLLLAPVSVWLAWKAGLVPARRPAPLLGAMVLVAAVLLRFASELAAELFTMRFSMMLAGMGLVTFFAGLRQLRHWWLPAALLVLSIPLPDLITSTIALPLQFMASKFGAALLAWRDVPVALTGNIIMLPGHKLFVSEACSGLRSLTALLSLGLMIGWLTLRTMPTRVTLLLVTVGIAIVMNGFRVFLTGFLVYFVNPGLGEGFMHVTEGWLLFVVSLGLVYLAAMLMGLGEKRFVTSPVEAP